MSSFKNKYVAATALTITGFNSLAAAGLASSDAIDNSTNLYLDFLVEFVIADFAEAGNGLLIFGASSSLDGTSYSRADSANLGALAPLGHFPVIGTGAWRTRAFSLARAFGGTLPPYAKVHVYNDAGTTLAATGNACQIVPVYREIL